MEMEEVQRYAHTPYGGGAQKRASEALLVGNKVFALGSGELTQGLYI